MASREVTLPPVIPVDILASSEDDEEDEESSSEEAKLLGSQKELRKCVCVCV